jgi:hypothetical protein
MFFYNVIVMATFYVGEEFANRPFFYIEGLHGSK